MELSKFQTPFVAIILELAGNADMMKRMITIGLLTLCVAGSGAPLQAWTQRSRMDQAMAAKPPATSSSLQSRDVFYLSERFGFRLVYPRGYVIEPTDAAPSKQPNQPLQVLEIWQQADFLNRMNLPETPPTIRISIYDNARRLPLTRWKGELSRNDDRALTVAGQQAIAYTSTGLYENDNVLVSSADGRYVFRIQVGYLNANDRIRQTFQELVSSFTFDVLPSPNARSKWRINYDRLQRLLADRHWQAADVETRAIFQRLVLLSGGERDLLYSSKRVFAPIPATDLRTIDTLWSKASNGRFGFSAQQRIWRQITANTKNPKLQVERFAQAVGWRRSRPLPENNPVGMELAGTQWRLDTELNYTEAAPIGQFPWPGVSSSRLVDFLNERSLGCGSCTTDAIYLASDRYYDYLPALFTKLNADRR